MLIVYSEKSVCINYFNEGPPVVHFSYKYIPLRLITTLIKNRKQNNIYKKLPFSNPLHRFWIASSSYIPIWIIEGLVFGKMTEEKSRSLIRDYWPWKITSRGVTAKLATRNTISNIETERRRRIRRNALEKLMNTDWNW